MKDQGDWLQRLGELQQQYWDGWRDLTAQAMAGAPSDTRPWQEGMEAWARVLGLGRPAQGNTFFPFGGSAFSQSDPLERLIEQGKRYVGLLQAMFAGDGFRAGQDGFDPRAWLEQMRSLHERSGQDLLGRLESVPWFGGLQTAQVEQLVKTLAGLPTQGMKEELQAWLSLPAFGYTREHQARAQRLASDWLDYLEAQKRYDELMLACARRTFEVLEGKLAEREQPGRQIRTPRELYDLWIDAAEDAYADVAMGDAFREVYGDLVNAQMRVRAGINGEIERIGSLFGLPTRTEVDSLARQLHELKRELRRRDGRAGAPAAGPETGAAAAAAAPARKAKPRPAGKTSKQVAPATAPATATRAKKNARRAASRGEGRGGVTPIIQSTRAKAGKRG